jgi:very-short-patch-repair endonuclease
MPDVDGKSGLRGGIDHPRQQMALVAARQGGVVSRDQLSGLGFTDKQILHMADDGSVHRLHHNVFAVGHRRLNNRAHLFAALLSLGPRAFLSHRTAAAVHGLRSINLHEVEMTVPGSGGRARDGLVIHRTRKEPHHADVRTHGDLRVSAIPRMLIELAGRETAAELERLVTMAVQKRLLRPDSQDGRAALEAALARHPRHPGLATLTAVLAVYRRTESRKSELERTFDRLLAAHPELPKPLCNIEIDHWEIDCFWPEHNLAVELDGRAYHVAAGAMEKDRIKDAFLLRQDITPLRFTDFRMEHDVRGILRDLHHFLEVA